ncbi:TPA: LD-carboxypeptidase LdcB/DacB [Streptococcus suis]
MKQRYWILLGISLITLAACGNSQEKQTSESNSQSSQTLASSNSSQEVASSSTQAEADTSSSSEASQAGQVSQDAAYNGSYYYVEGKYGPVIIVNKKHPLASSYSPGEDPTALASFLELLANMQAQGFAVSNQYSGFRSYETQASLYQNYVNQDGQANADRYSARPGYSEHQTGLAFDLIDTAGNLLTEPTACQWLSQHAHEYGFVVRYLEGKEASTGYMPESWHIRYVGQEATEIYQSGLTLEEYYGVEGGDYAQ